MFTFSTEEIQAELAALENTEARAASYYLKKELNRRRGSKNNPGRPVQFTDEKHVKDRIRRRKDNAR